MDFGPWLPDLPPNRHQGLTEATNVYPSPNGYKPIGAMVAITDDLPGINGGASYVASEGTTALLGGTDTDLYSYSAGVWSSAYTTTTSERWQFTQYGDNAIGVMGAEPVAFDIIAGTAAALGGSPPDASSIATVRDFVWLAGDPSHRQRLSISGYNDSTEWTPGTNQSTQQDFPDGGPIMGLASGEYGLILQRGAIKRGSYLGDGTVNWQFDEISANIGCIARGSVAQAGRMVFFLSERGFMRCDGNEATPIGNERIDATFFGSYPRSDLANMTSAIDPRRFVAVWAMPGNPGRLYLYNWAQDRWSMGEMSVQAVFGGFTANVSIDDLGALYPGGIDTIPYSLDDPVFSGGDPLLLLADNDGYVGSLAGTPLTATLTTAMLEPTPGRFTRITNTLPMTDAATMALTIVSKGKLSDDGTTKTASSVRSTGHLPIRCNGRYHTFSLTIANDDWSFVQGIDLDPKIGSAR